MGTIQRLTADLLGKDARSSDLTRQPQAATEFRNIIRRNDELEKRPGGKILTSDGGFLGQYAYAYSNLTTGETVEELLSIGTELYKSTVKTFVITYSGSNSPVQFNLKLDPDSQTFKATIVEDIAGVLTTRLDYDLGTGYESSPITLANLKTQIDTISGGTFSVAISGTTSLAAALTLPITLNADLATSPKTATLSYYQDTAVNNTVSTPFSAYYAARGSEEFELASTVNLQDCLYIATGYEYLHKYDGQRVYRAGVPIAVKPTVSLVAGSLVGTYRYLATYEQTDTRGNYIEGTQSVVSDDITPATNAVSVVMTNIQAGTGFNTGCAGVNGNQSGAGTQTGLTVSNTPHTIQIGDKVTFLDRTASPPSIVTRTITATTATTISWASTTAVTVTNGDVISCGLIINLYRNADGGTDFYLQGQYPNNSFQATQTQTDTMADATLITRASYLQPVYDPDPLSAKPRYLAAHQGLLIAAGAFATPNTVYYSDVQAGAEGFTEDVTLFEIKSTVKGGVTGLASNQEYLIVGKQYSLFAVTGDLADDRYSIEMLTEGGHGIACHNASANVNGDIIFLSSDGFHMIQGGYNIVPIGEPINSAFTEAQYSNTRILKLKRAAAAYHDRDMRYYCFVPTETGSGTSAYANSNSRVYYFDSRYQLWGEYSGLNMGGGICVFENELHWRSRRTHASLTVTGNLWRCPCTNTVHDYADHEQPIDMLLAPQWDYSGSPSVFKKALRLKVYNLSRSNLVSAFGLGVETYLDFVRAPHTKIALNFGSGGSLGWGLFPWGISPWGTPAIRERKSKLRSGKYRALQFVFSNNEIHEKVSITGYEYEIVPQYAEKMKE